MKSESRIWLFETLNSPGWNTDMSCLSLLQGIFPTQESNWGLLHCTWILYQLNHRGNPRILEGVAYPFSSRSSQPKNRTRVSCSAGRFFTNWAIMKHYFCRERQKLVSAGHSGTQDWAAMPPILISQKQRMVSKTFYLPDKYEVNAIRFSNWHWGRVTAFSLQFHLNCWSSAPTWEHSNISFRVIFCISLWVYTFCSGEGTATHSSIVA